MKQSNRHQAGFTIKKRQAGSLALSVAEVLESRRLLTASAYQAVTWSIGPMAADPVRNLVYLVDATDSRLLAIDTDLGRTVSSQKFTGTATSIAVATEDDRLFLSTSTASTVQIFSLPSLAPLPSINLDFVPTELAAGAGQRLYAEGSSDGSAISEVNENTGKTLWHLSDPANYEPLMKTSGDGTRLYTMVRGLSSVSTFVYQHNINTSAQPQLTAQYTVPEANGEDFAVDEANNRVFSMNGGVYSVHVTDMVTDQQSDWQDGGIYGAAVSVAPNGNRVFGGSYSNIRVYNRTDGSTIADVPVVGGSLRSSGLASTTNGNAIYIAGSDIGYIGGSTLVADNVPVARFTPTQTTPGTFSFNASTSELFKASQGLSITGYAWSFGDGTTGVGLTTSHTYSAPGDYNVQLTVTTSNNLTDTFVMSVHKNDSLEAHAGGPYIADIGQNITLNANGSIGQITSYLWDFNYQNAVFTTDATGVSAVLPAASAVGSRAVALEVSDGVNSRIDVTSVQTLAINTAPSFTGAGDVTVLEDAGPQSITGWASNISAGPPDEAGQTVVFNIVSDSNTALFSAAPVLNSSTGTLNFTSAPNANGSATIVAQLSDNGGIQNGGNDASPLTTFAINVTPVNDAPVATAASYVAANDGPTSIKLTGTDVDNDSLTFAVVTGPSNGTLAGTAPNLSYTPAAGFLGNDSFTFTANDGQLTSSPATITLRVNGRSTAYSQVVTTAEDTSLPITLLATDPNNDTLTYSIVTGPSHGTLSQVGNAVTYKPAANYNGNDVFTFATSDGLLSSAPAQVSITITPVDDAPIAMPDIFAATPTGASDSGNLLANDQDIDGVGIAVSSFTQPSHGTVEYSGQGVFSYLATGAYTGVDSFNYTIADPRGYKSTTTVSVSVGTASLAGSWATLGNDAGRTGYFPGSLLGSNIVTGWSKQFSGSLNPAVVANGQVFLTDGSYFGAMSAFALDAATGNQNWIQSFAPGFSMNPPTYDNGQVYFQRGDYTGDTAVWSLSATDGSITWQAPHSAQWENYKAPLVVNGHVYVDGGSYGGLYGFNQSNGSQLFFSGALAQDDDWAPTYYNGKIYEATGSRLAEHDSLTGAIDWSVSFANTDYTYQAPTAVIANGWAYIATGADLYGINLTTHAIGWDEKVVGPSLIEPSVANGVVYAGANPAQGQGTDSGSVEAFDAITGTLLKTYSGVAPGHIIVTDDAIISSPLAAGDKTTLFDKTSGTVLDVLPVSGNISLADNVLYVVGGANINTFDFQPANSVPTAVATLPSSVPEGGSATFSATNSTGASSYDWDFNYDGQTFTTDASGATVNFSAAGLDGPTTRTVALRVSNGSVSNIVTGTVAITNVAPTALFTGSNITVGAVETVAFSSVVDPSAADVAAGFTYSYDFNNDGTYDSVTATASATVPAGYLSTPGTYTIAAKISDKDGGFTVYTTNVVVNPGSTPVISRLSGTIIGTSGSYQNNGNTIAKAFDGSLTTYYDGASANGNWLGLDLGSGYIITSVAYVSRSGNGLPARMNGGIFQGSNTANFSSGVVNLYTIASNANPSSASFTTQAVTNTSTFRYVRYLSPNGSYGDVTELQFYGKPATVVTPTTGSVSGTVIGPSSATVYLDANNNGVLDSGELSTTANGSYSFSNVPIGSYAVRQVVPSGYTQTTPGGGYSINVTAGSTFTGENFVDTSNTTTGSTKLTGTTIGTSGSYQNSGNTIAKALDGNLTTYYDGASANGNWVGLDLGSTYVITSISYASRSGLASRMNGGIFQGSNSATFASGVVNLYTIGSSANPSSTTLTTQTISNTTAFRYVRYLSPNGSYGDVAEVQFFGTASGGTVTPPPTLTQFTGATIGTTGSYQNSGTTIAKATDGSLTTFYDGASANGNWVGLDLGTGKTVKQISFAPRSNQPSRMMGGIFQASNTANFSSGVVNLYTVTTAPVINVLTSVSLNVNSTYRYYRYLSPNGSYGDIAEIAFYG